MTNKLKLVLAGLMVAAALVTANFTMGTPSASAQSPYCQVNPTLCTATFCATYPQLCNLPGVNPIYPVYPVNTCGYLNCVSPIYNTCAPVPYSPIYGTAYRPPCYSNLAYQGYAGYGYPYGVCTFNQPCNVPFTGGAPARVNLAVSPAIATCGSTAVTVSANITDGFGVAVANGTSVSFTSTIGAIGGATTVGGNATATLTIPAGSSAGIASITVRAGSAAASTTVQVNCAPVVQQIVVQQVVARPSPGNVVYQPAPQQGPQQQVIIQRAPQPRGPQGPAYIPPFAPPRTGEAGLIDAILAPAGDDAANQSLVDAWRESQYGVLDASQYDWVVNPDDSAASIQLANDLLDEAYAVIDASQVDLVIVADDSAASTGLVHDVLSNPTGYGN